MMIRKKKEPNTIYHNEQMMMIIITNTYAGVDAFCIDDPASFGRFGVPELMHCFASLRRPSLVWRLSMPENWTVLRSPKFPVHGAYKERTIRYYSCRCGQRIV